MSSFIKRIVEKVEQVLERTEDVVKKKDVKEEVAINDEEVDKSGKRQHRFGSFAPEHEGNFVKWHVDGHDYLFAVSELLDRAQESIFILDWWLTPELYLRRPPAYHPEWRLDRLLKRKAEQGVKIYVVVYKEIPETMSMDSYHTEQALLGLHENIACMRHPDHIPERLFEKDIVEYWSHHEKLVVVDRTFACIGGIDLSFGRWDTSTHPLADVHPTDFSKTLFPGQDYNNARLLDFQHVEKYAQNELSILSSARMPWHDIHMTMQGDVVHDIVQHFVERWNFIKKLKYSNEQRYAELSLNNEVTSDVSNDENNLNKASVGSVRAQVVRSVSKWSHGVPLEKSVQDAYIQLIKDAEHFIYIENQFFITSTGDHQPVVNQIGKAIMERVKVAAQNGTKFKVVIVIPEMPGFAGSINDESSIRTIMAAQYRSINRGGHSVFEEIQAAGYDPNEFIRFYNLRAYDRINAPYKSFVAQIEKNSGVTFQEAQVALGVQWTSPPSKATIRKERQSRSVKVLEPGSPVERVLVSNTADITADSVAIPPNEEEAKKVIETFELGAKTLRSDEDVSDNVVQHMLKDTTTLFNEKWLGTADEELDAYVSELVYIHAKVMIVDDRRVILGSANLNDRSQKGDGDSEIALVIDDEDKVDSTMNGRPYQVSRFAASLRRRLYKEHLGLIKPDLPSHREETVTSYMRPVPYKSEDTFGTPEDELVADPLSDRTIQLWNKTAKSNTEIFAKVFRPVPSNEVKDWEEYKNYVPHVKAGHVVPDITLEEIKTYLAQVKGTLEECPMDFLINQKDFVDNIDWSGLDPTLQIYI